MHLLQTLSEIFYKYMDTDLVNYSQDKEYN